MMHPPTTDTELPQPPRDPFPTTPQEAFAAPEEVEGDDTTAGAPAEAPEAPEAPQPPRVVQTLGVTAVRQIDDRVGVMLKRFDSYRSLLANYGVTEGGTYIGLKAELHESLAHMRLAEEHIQAAAERTAHVREVRESL